jgi:hypothetical protein
MNLIAQLYQLDFWIHFFLAIVLYFGLWFFLPLKYQLYESKKRTLFLYVMSIAFIYELIEPIWNLGAYSGWRHLFLDSIVDMGAALIVCFLLTLILRGK